MAFGILLPHSGTESEAITVKAMSPNPGATREFPCGEAVIIFINCTVNLLFLSYSLKVWWCSFSRLFKTFHFEKISVVLRHREDGMMKLLYPSAG